MKKTFIALLVPVLFACSDDPEPATVVLPEPTNIDKMIGNYSFTAVITSLADANITQESSGDLSITNDSPVLYQLNFDGDIFNLANLKEASNGAAFDINDITLTDSDGDQFVIKGSTTTTLEGKDYHGRYDTGSSQLVFNLETDYVNPDYDYLNLIVEVLATKK